MYSLMEITPKLVMVCESLLIIVRLFHTLFLNEIDTIN
jgi:hypothetical protein